MKKFIFVLFAAVFLLPSCASADVVTTKPCLRKELGKVKDNAFECKKVGVRFRWVEITKATPAVANKVVETQYPNALFSDSCNADPEVPAEWAEYQKFAIQNFNCARFYKYVNFNGKISLDSNVTQSSLLDNPLACKVENVSSDRINLTQNANIQIIPIQFLDKKSNSNPLSDYKKYFDFIESYYKNTSDNESKLNFIVPDKYIQINKNFTDYNFKDNESSKKFLFDGHAIADPVIDFSKADMTMFVFPLSVDPSTMMKFVSMLWVNTNEKVIKNTYISVPPVMLNSGSWFGVEPTLWVLEVAHFMGLPDRYGDDRPFFAGNAGAGSWGITSRIGTDFLVWDRWSASMIKDQQVRCVNGQKSTTHQVVASTIKGNYTKAVAVKLDNNKSIFIESIRPYGYNYKLPAYSHGALVYLVDSSDRAKGRGVSVIDSPKNPLYINNFGYPYAPLSNGESLEYNGYRISVISSNNFSDTVKVEKLGN